MQGARTGVALATLPFLRTYRKWPNGTGDGIESVPHLDPLHAQKTLKVPAIFAFSLLSALSADN